MPLKIAFAGFRHSHIFNLYNLARKSAELEIVGACEGHEPTRANIRATGRGLGRRSTTAASVSAGAACGNW